MFIVLIGPDGCGKTTIANGIVSRHKALGFNKATHFATNFGNLPTFGKIKTKLYSLVGRKYSNKYKHEEGEYLSGMKHEPNSCIKSILLVFWYGVDYFTGHYYINSAKKNNELVVFARYYFDFYYQRVHLKLPKYICRMVECIVPQPDFIFFLKRHPEDIFKIKPELSIDEIKRQNHSIINNFSKRKNFRVINSQESIDDTINNVIALLEGKNGF